MTLLVLALLYAGANALGTLWLITTADNCNLWDKNSGFSRDTLVVASLFLFVPAAILAVMCAVAALVSLMLNRD